MSHLFAGLKQEIRREKTSGRTATLNEAVTVKLADTVLRLRE